MKKIIFLMGITLCALSPFFVYGQLLDPVDYSIVDAPDTARAGERIYVTVEATIDDNWHLYSTQNDPDAGPFPTQFSSASEQMTIAGDVSETEATIAFDPNFEVDLGWHSSSAQFTIPIQFNGSEQGNTEIILEVLYQVCDDRSCLPPKTKQIQKEIVLAGVIDSNTGFFSGISVLSIIEWFWLIFTVVLTVSFVNLLLQKKISRTK